MVTLLGGYKLFLLTRMVWSVCALAMGVVIGKYRPTKSSKNMAICLVTCVGLMSWFLQFLTYVLKVVVGIELF